MAGGIYTREVCTICGDRLKDNGRNAVSCPAHPGITARRMVVQFGRKHSVRFTVYAQAQKHLNFLRHEKDEREDLFDIKDYSAKRPKSFAVLAPRYLAEKRDLGRKSIRKIERTISLASELWGYTNLRDITGGEIAAFLRSLKDKKGKPIGAKTRANYQTHLHNFWMWALEEDAITLAEMPKFRKIEYKLGYRKTTTWEIQRKVIDKVKEISLGVNPKIWLAIDMLSCYVELRPGDLLKIREGDYRDGFVDIYDPTKKERTDQPWITIRLLDEHRDAWEKMRKQYPGVPGMPFFRHHKGMGGVRPGSVFGDKFLGKYWNKAAAIEGLEGVPLYPGTRHTTVTETSRAMGPDEAKRATGHRTNKAFDRYNLAINEGAFQVVSRIRKKQMGDVVSLRRDKKEGAE